MESNEDVDNDYKAHMYIIIVSLKQSIFGHKTQQKKRERDHT